MSDCQNDVERMAESDMETSLAHQNQGAIAGPSNDRLLTPMLKLDVDCFEEIFEYLSLANLRSLRQTCKRLKQVVDYFINTNYPAVKIGYGRIQWDCAQKFDQLRKMDPVSMKKIKVVTMTNKEMTQEQINVIKDVLPRIERLEIILYGLQHGFYESILKWCSNLKYLSVLQIPEDDPEHYFFNGENEWRHRQYPTIDHIRMDEFGILTFNPDWRTLFELNPNIQTFSCTTEFLVQNARCFLNSSIKIDLWNIREKATMQDQPALQDEAILNQLYEQGFYKRLHLYEWWNALHGLNVISGLEKLHIKFNERRTLKVTLPIMPELKELCFHILIEGDGDKHDYKHAAKDLNNVQRVYFNNAKCDKIIPFIRYAPKVKEIKIDRLRDGLYCEEGVINLSALNKERKGLADANKITIYVDERTFLATKMATMKTELSLVILKRVEAIEWIHEY